MLETLPPEKGKNITYWMEGDVICKEKLLKKSSLKYSADALKTWKAMRLHLKEVRATYANLPRQEKNHNTRMKLHSYELKLIEYIKRLEGVIQLHFVEYQREWEYTSNGY